VGEVTAGRIVAYRSEQPFSRPFVSADPAPGSVELARPARLAGLLRGHWGSGRCTISATPPSPRTAQRSAPAPAPRHGLPTQPGHRRAQPSRAGQPRRRTAPPRPRPRPAPGHPWHHPRSNHA
jgi:hypothetical protein